MTKKRNENLQSKTRPRTLPTMYQALEPPSKSPRILVLKFTPNAAHNEKKRGLRLPKLQGDGGDPDLAERVLQQKEEIAIYQKKVFELSVMVDLLKKLQTSGPYQPESELSGLIAITKKSDRKRKRSK
jgi:hypothetical protein